MGGGSPEFIITFEEIPDLVIVIECKADVRKHRSKNGNRPKDFAVDGVLLYSEYLAKEFDVIAVAISGQNETELKISNFLQLKIQKAIEKPDNSILEFEDYIHLYKNDPEKEKNNISHLMRYSKKLHNDLRDNGKLSEPEKPLLVSAILISLTDDSFRAGYPKKKTSKSLATLLLTTVKEVLIAGKLDENKRETILHPYSFIRVHPELTKETDNTGKAVRLLFSLIKDIETNVLPFVNDYTNYDVLGQFYGEFLRYTGGDKKGLGIVLTPKHMADLFIDLANLDKDDVVFDNCCGTGSFLISAMKKMTDKAGNDVVKRKCIREQQLIGIEQQSSMFALACANMILRGDGKASIYQENCFAITDKILMKHKCSAGFLNPPYSQKGDGLGELDFVQQCLQCIEKGRLCFAIVPLNCATSPSQQKENLLKEHTLEAVMSLPNELFQPASSVVTCLMVFRAKIKHESDRETWFGYWKDDGFVKTKHEGRTNKYHKWDTIKKEWRDVFINRKINDKSVLHEVVASSEWCAEAYMQTDYSKIDESDLVDSLKEYAIFHISEKGIRFD